MTYEIIDTKEEKVAYFADMAAERDAERRCFAEAARRDWAQRNGNDSGFDPYAGCEYED